MGKKAFRKQYIFHLDLAKPSEDTLAAVVDDLKAKRSYSRAIKNGLAIASDLEAGRLDALLECYPWIGELLKSDGQGAKTNNGGAGGNGGLSDAALDKAADFLLAKVEGKLLNSGLKPISPGQPLASLPFPSPATDDSQLLANLEVTAAQKSGDENPTYNLLIGVALQQNNVQKGISELPTPMLEYGLSRGKFNGSTDFVQGILASRQGRNIVRNSSVKRDRAKGQGGNAKPLVGASITLTQPNFEGLDLL